MRADMQRISRFFKTAGIYFVGNIITKLAAFFLLPLYSSRISPSEYGNYGLMITLINVFVPICFVGIWEGVFRFSFACGKDEEKYQVFNNGFIVMLTGSALYIAGVLILYLFIHFFNPMLICLYSIATGFQYFYTVIARSLMDNKLFVLSGLTNTCVSITLNIILIAGYGIGVESLYISYVAGVAFQIFIIEYKKSPSRYFSVRNANLSETIKYAKFSMPVTFSAISNWTLNGLTQMYITYSIGNYYNGLYNIANKFSSVLVLIIGMFQFAWYEMAYGLAEDTNKNRYYKKCISEILRLSIICVSICILFVKIIYPFLVDPQYDEGLSIIPILLIGTTANAYAGFVGTLFLADKKTHSLFTTTLTAGLLNLTGLIILTPLWGFCGAVLSLCVAYIVYALLRIIILNKEIGILPYAYSVAPTVLLVVSITSFYLIKSYILLFITAILLCVISIFLIRDLIIICIKTIKK